MVLSAPLKVSKADQHQEDAHQGLANGSHPRQ
jgi:hypothetical protein